jgi:hypothetical protein
MGALSYQGRSHFNPRSFDRLGWGQLIELRETVEVALETRARQFGLSDRKTELIAPAASELVLSQRAAIEQAGVREALGGRLSPSQVRTFLDCSAKWWFKYGLGLPEPKTSWLAFGLAVHAAVETNFRSKLETGEDLERAGAVMAFRDAWREQMSETRFHPGEDPRTIGRTGERLVARYVTEVAPQIRPAAVELEVEGEIAGVKVSGRVDLLDVEGRLIDIKTASRRPSSVSPDHAFQLATYRQITPGASGEARLDTLVRTQMPDIVEQSYRVGEQDLRATTTLFAGSGSHG